ncbi:NUDIX hydrolase [Candidatus Kaiserbacteria bacterium]|nr:NUDIX hydrolase [Candidatus Kaiserbacteria bacterium]
MEDKFYQYSLPQPYHISVGAVVFNDKYEICLHHFEKKNVPEHLQFLGDYLDDVWHLVRESLEGDESLQTAVLRGVQEELGIEGRVEKYLGSKIDIITSPYREPFEKMTPYHAVRAVSVGERPNIDAENKTIIEWHSPQAALEIYREQAKKTTRPELDEAIIIARFIDAYGL